MVTAVFIIAVLNFCLGFALAVYLGMRGGQLAERPLAIQTTSVAAAKETSSVLPRQRTEQDSERSEEEVPQEFLDMLEEAEESRTFVEAAVHVLRLEVGKYRERLIKIDEMVRKCAANPDRQVIQDCLDALRQTNDDWLSQQQDAVSHLQDRQDDLGDFQMVGNGLEDVLLEQAAQIETTSSNIDLLDFDTDVTAGCYRLITELCKLMDLAHGLRDRMMESFVTIMAADGKLASIDKSHLYDGASEVFNRTGLERVFINLWGEDSNRIRQTCIAAIDIDRFGRINEGHGPRRGDQFLTAFGSLLHDLLPKDRDGDVVARSNGQRYILVFADTGPRAATSVVERIRQAIEKTTFHHPKGDLEVTVSCGVVEARTDDTTLSLFDRAAKTVREAKRAGRNMTFMHNGREPAPIDAPTFEVPGHDVRLHD